MRIKAVFEKMVFQDEEEKANFEKYKKLKGEDLFYQIYRILSESQSPVKYVTVSSYVRYDKNLRDKLYIYMATLEEYYRAQFLDAFDVLEPKKYEMHCYNQLNKDLIKRTEGTPSVLYYGFQPDFRDLMRICNDMGVCEIDNSSQKHIKKLRNETMHHALIMFGKAQTTSRLEEHFKEIEKRLNAFVQALPQEYRAGFLSDLQKLNQNAIRNTKYLSKYCLEVLDGRICVKR